MKTKVLLSAALIAAGIAVADAQQVYSVNAVGYVNVTLVTGFNLLANPLKGTNNQVSTILPSVPDGSSLLTWNAGAQDFNQADAYIGGWVDGDGNPSTRVLDPGQGFFLQSAGAATITFVGEVSQGFLTNRISSNFGFYGSQVPQNAPLSSLLFPGCDGMSVYLWKPPIQDYGQSYTFVSGAWFDGDGNPNDPIIGVGEGFLLFNPCPPINWTRTFSVNN